MINPLLESPDYSERWQVRALRRGRAGLEGILWYGGGEIDIASRRLVIFHDGMVFSRAE